MAELMGETSFIEKKHSSRYQAEKLKLEEKIKSRAKVRNNKWLPLSGATYWEIKHDDDIT